MTFIRLLPLDELGSEPVALEAAGHELLVLRADDGVVVVRNQCTHMDRPLTRGTWNPGTQELTCPFHKAVFCLGRGGHPRVGPTKTPLALLPVRIAAGFLEVDVSDL